MLASLIAVSLMASSSNAATPTRTQMAQHLTSKHAAVSKAMHTKSTPVQTSSIASLADDMGYAMLNVYNGPCSDDNELQGVYTVEYGHCLLSYDTNYQKNTLVQNMDMSWNRTVMSYASTDTDCSGDALSSYLMVVPGTCADSSDLGGAIGGYYVYASETVNKFSVDSNTFGSIDYNTEEDCESEENALSAFSMLFDTCYMLGEIEGYTYYYTKQSCANDGQSYYLTTDCSGDPLVVGDDDNYAGDDDDDDDDDDFYGYGSCFYRAGSGDELVSYEADYCEGSAASALVTPSKMLVFAATAAAFASLF